MQFFVGVFLAKIGFDHIRIILDFQRRVGELDEFAGGKLILHQQVRQERDALAASVERQRAAGLDLVMVEGADLRELAPAVSPRAIAGSYSREDGHANPGMTTKAFAAAAARQ